VDSFVGLATEAFLAGYRDGVAPDGEPGTIALNLDMLDLFLIEKAAYEVVYEAANRPTWISVPLHGLAQCTRHLLGIAAIA
jgi:maltose alpha-D-glucosyltransferase / alpha-amylase